MRRGPAILLLTGLLASAGAAADESQFALKYDLRRDVVNAHCITCHSLDYIPLMGPQTRGGWREIVERMRHAFGADIESQEARTIVDYLYERYGDR